MLIGATALCAYLVTTVSVSESRAMIEARRFSGLNSGRISLCGISVHGWSKRRRGSRTVDTGCVGCYSAFGLGRGGVGGCARCWTAPHKLGMMLVPRRNESLDSTLYVVDGDYAWAGP